MFFQLKNAKQIPVISCDNTEMNQNTSVSYNSTLLLPKTADPIVLIFFITVSIRLRSKLCYTLIRPVVSVIS